MELAVNQGAITGRKNKLKIPTTMPSNDLHLMRKKSKSKHMNCNCFFSKLSCCKLDYVWYF